MVDPYTGFRTPIPRNKVLFTGGSCTRDTLIADAGGELVTTLAWPFQEVVWVGMLMSTLGAGLQSLAGAPRLLAAIGREGLIPEFRAFAPAEGEEPRLAVAFCATLSLGAVMLGDLNAVAPFITMWFLTCYGEMGEGKQKTKANAGLSS
jgi:potassium/chloride transporter 4/5/6